MDSVITLDISTVVKAISCCKLGCTLDYLIDIDDHIYALFLEAISAHSSRNLWTGYILLLCIHTQSHIAQKVDNFKGIQDSRQHSYVLDSLVYIEKFQHKPNINNLGYKAESNLRLTHNDYHIYSSSIKPLHWKLNIPLLSFWSIAAD